MDEFAYKKVALVGLSTEGQDALQFFVDTKASIIACDRRDETTMRETYPELFRFGDRVSFSFGPSYLGAIKDADVIVRTPGMALFTPELVEAKNRGAHITSNTKIFLSLCKAPIIGVTGTKGKGTTSTLIYEMIQATGKTVYLGGNVGKPLLSIVRSITPDNWVVLELSSFQLEDFDKSPHISVVLRTTQEHLANFDPLASNYHKTREEYVDAKRNIVKHQGKDDIAVLFRDDPTSSSFAQHTSASILQYGHKTGDARIRDDAVFVTEQGKEVEIASVVSMRLLGKHNLENIAAATLAAQSAGVPIQIIQKVAQNFKGLPHRLETAAEKHGVLFINDSFSTTPETTIAAIHTFQKPIVIILGGSEKGADFTDMGKEIAHSSVKVAIVIGQMTERIVQSLQKANFTGKVIPGLTTMKDMVETAYHEAQPGDVVLLSPGCASFGLFKNYKERGKQFMYEAANIFA